MHSIDNLIVWVSAVIKISTALGLAEFTDIKYRNI